MKSEGMLCYCCSRAAPLGTPGWDREGPYGMGQFAEYRNLCPKHRRSRPQALASLGELVLAHQEKLARAR